MSLRRAIDVLTDDDPPGWAIVAALALGGLIGAGVLALAVAAGVAP